MTMPESFADPYATRADAFHNHGGIPAQHSEQESPLEYLDFPGMEELQHHLMRTPAGMCSVHGFDGSPDWDRLLDCGCEPADPHQRLRWKHMREAFDSIKPFLKERETRIGRYLKQRDYQTTLAALKKRDPLYERTMEVMEQLTRELPQVVKELCMPTLAREFGAFLKLYAELREVAEVLENHGHHKKRRARAGDSGDIPARHRGSATNEKDREQERRELVARMKEGRAEDGDLIRYMELTDEQRREGR